MENEGQFNSCRFDFRIDNKNGLTPSRRKRSERRNVNYNTLFKCKICGQLLESRAELLAHKVSHFSYKCDICEDRFQKKSVFVIHMRKKHGQTVDENSPDVNDISQTSPTAGVDDDHNNPTVASPETLTQMCSEQVPQLIPPPGSVASTFVTTPTVPTPTVPTPTVPTPTSMVNAQNYPGFVCINLPVYMTNTGVPNTPISSLPNVMTTPQIPSMPPTVTTPHYVIQTPPTSSSLRPFLLSSSHAPPSCVAPPLMSSPHIISPAPSTFNTLPVDSTPMPPLRNPKDSLEPGEIPSRKNVMPFSIKNSALFRASPTTNDSPCESSDEVLDFSLKRGPTDDFSPVSKKIRIDTEEIKDSTSDVIDLSCKKNESTVQEGDKAEKDVAEDEVVYQDDKALMQEQYKNCSDVGVVGPSEKTEVKTCSSKKKYRGGLNKMVEMLWKNKMTVSEGGMNDHSGSNGQTCVGSRESPVMLSEDVRLETSESVELELVARERPLASSGLFGNFTSSNDVEIEEQASQVIEVMSPAPTEGGQNHDSYKEFVITDEKPAPTDYTTCKFHVCPVCKELFSNSVLMRHHMRKEHVSAKSNKKGNLRNSKGKRQPKKMQCPRCTFSTSSLFALKYHRVTMHPDMHGSTALSPLTSNPQLGPTNIPQTVPEQNHAIDEKISNTRERTLTCRFPGCGKIFKDHSNLRVHQVYHTAVTPTVNTFGQAPSGNAPSWNLNTLNKQHMMETMQNSTRTNSNALSETPSTNVVNASSEDNVVDLTTSSNQPSTNDTVDNTAPSWSGVQESLNDQSSRLSLCRVEPSPGTVPQFYTSVMRFCNKSSSSGSVTVANKLNSRCGLCGVSFDDSEALWRHKLAAHPGEFSIICDSCGYSTTTQTDLQSHMMSTHGKELGEFKDCICFLCGKGYASKTGLVHHMMKHNEEGTPGFECPRPGCHSRLISKAALRSHIRRIHLKTNQSHFNQRKSRFDKTALESTLEGSCHLVCKFPGCERMFRESKHLKVHMMQHTDEKPLKCELCFYSCRQRNSMNWHMKSKHAVDKHVTADGRTIYLTSSNSVPN